MSRQINQNLPCLLRQLAAIEGYLDLDLPEMSLEVFIELESQTGFSLNCVDIFREDPLFASWMYLKGETLLESAEYHKALPYLEQAARLIPSPLNKPVWYSLTACYHHLGAEELAEIAFAKAESRPTVLTEETYQLIQQYGEELFDWDEEFAEDGRYDFQSDCHSRFELNQQTGIESDDWE